MATLLRVAMARVRGILRPGDGEHDFDEELEAHLAMATEDKIRQGLSPREARRRARIELGNLTQLREAGREARGLPWIGSSWLDVKLGLRMLRKSWGLTLVAGLAMTVVIGLAAVASDVLAAFGAAELPLDEGDRVVALEIRDLEANEALGASPLDLERWSSEMRSLDDVGAFRTVERNLRRGESSEPGREAEVVAVAEMSAAGFRLARVAPVLGRSILPDDQLPSADPVLVIGQAAWRSRFASDPEILGRRVRLDGTVHTIVGVMPEGFGFPVSHRFWTPLREGATSLAGADDLLVFARLGAGATIEQAQAELRGVGRVDRRWEAADAPAREVALRVVPYATAFTGEIPPWMASLALVCFAFLLVPPCINVALLVYARTVTRQGEIAARCALGASRFHIVSQLFLEILVLAAGAGVIALGAARLVVRVIVADLEARGNSVPFWMEIGSSPRTALLVGALAVVAALLAGAVPALQATGSRMQSGLRSLGGQTPVRLGPVWTSMIVLQVACSFALLPTSVEMTWGTLRSGLLGPGFPADEYVTARLETEADRQAELVRHLTAEPTVASVTLSSSVPSEEPWLRIETEGAGSARSAGGASPGLEIGGDRVVRVNHVDEAFFDVFEIPRLAGRAFGPADFAPGANAVLVNQSFVSDVLGGGNPLGRRIRYRSGDREAAASETRPDRWFEIVGVVADLEKHASDQTVYHPAPPGQAPAVSLALRVRSDPTAAADALREVAWRLDPALRVSRVQTLDSIYRQHAVGNYVGAAGLVAATLSVLLLSAAGIYALLSFTVNRRRKEIGIRAALGARPWRLVAAIFGRAMGRIGLGAAGGVAVALLVGYLVPVADMGGWEVPGVIPSAAAFVGLIALLALLGPARRSLRVDPVQELREG
jgi:predicted permease